MPTFPTIHLNGSDGKSLLAGYEAAVRAVHAAVEALAETAPNARDYYVQGPEVAYAAQSEHGERVKRLVAVATELETLYWNVSEQVEARASRVR